MFDIADDLLGHFLTKIFFRPVWWKQFVEWVDTVDVVRAKLLLLLSQEEVANLNK